MIPIAELQIGNSVLYNGMEAIVYSIRGPYPDVSERFNNKATVDLILEGIITVTEDELEPILLNEDILLKCGIIGWIIDNRFECRLNFNESASIYAWKNGKSTFILDLNYFHVLQNWYLLHAKKDLLL
jgi:hypothetical protein